MNSRMVTAGFRMAQWAQVIQDRKTSGEKINAYCENRGISRDAYFYWQRKLRGAAYEQLAERETEPEQNTYMIGTGFAEVNIRESEMHAPHAERIPSGQLLVEIPGVKIRADAAYPARQLARLLQELVRPC